MTRRYKAFVSYAHSDGSWASWLHRSLEAYRLPRALRQKMEADGVSETRLFPIFLDRSELASSTDLTESIRNALDHSDALIVICSPAAARSRWVNEEIRYYQGMGKSDRIFCLIVDGSPDFLSEDCAFPDSLKRDKSGSALSEPLAADAQEHADGKRSASLKIIAGLHGVGVDDLMQRDSQRRLRNRGILSVGSIALAAIMFAFAITAQLAREESELRRKQAESLIGFMLGSFRERLEPIGKLDVLDEVGDQAMLYFQSLGEKGTSQEVLSRVLALRQIGEVRFRQGRLEEALEAFEKSRNLALKLSNGPKARENNLFELAQAEFWVAYVALEQGNFALARKSSENYLRHSMTLSELAPDNATYIAEVSYGYSNLGTLSMHEGEAAEALGYFQESLKLNQLLLASEPDDIDLQISLGDGYSWIGAAYLHMGELQASESAYRRAVAEHDVVRIRDESPLYWESLATNYYHLGNVLALMGDLESAMENFHSSSRLLDDMVRHDSENAIWLSDQAISSYRIGELALQRGELSLAGQRLGQAQDNLNALLAVDSNDLRSLEYLALTERSLGLLSADYMYYQSAYQRMSRVIASTEEITPRSAANSAIIGQSYGKALWHAGKPQEADSVWQQSLNLLRSTGVDSPTGLALRASLMINLNMTDAAEPLLVQLANIGYRDPRYLTPRDGSWPES